MNIPSATYRIQFNKDFTFKDFEGILDYLHELGISTIYASPILTSTEGSMHGYDVTDPLSLDPEIGSIEDLKRISGKLKSKGMTWIQDIVPNHMAFEQSNFRLMDVLERGNASPYYTYFDIWWEHPDPDLHNRVMVPFLGNELLRCVEKSEIKLSASKSGFVIQYFDSYYPISISGYDYLFSLADLSVVKDQWKKFIVDHATESDYKKWRSSKRKWYSLFYEQNESAVTEILEIVNSDHEKLLNLLRAQYYVLAFWKQTLYKLNYRRFFTINQLICLRMEDDFVFEEYHRFLKALFQEDIIQGCRIDHIDGLKDPSQYITRLRKLLGDKAYIIAEKILESKESLPSNWEIQGTSGYEFLAYTNQLFTDRKRSKQLLRFYKQLVPELPNYKDLVHRNKKMFLETYMQGDWDNITHYFFALDLARDFSFSKIKEALGALMISMPVYRIYPRELPLKGNDLAAMNEAFHDAKHINKGCETEMNYIETLMISPKEWQRAVILDFLQRLMQFTGPLTAKGVEDSTFYIYNPLISHDEVGDSPSTLGIRTGEFHSYMISRKRTTPYSLNATATHDTKRGEDVRIRLNILSQLPDEWQQLVTTWLDVNKQYRSIYNDMVMPSTNDEYFIYQAIIGGFPEDYQVTESWITRLKEYLVKVVREAKVNSNWETPNENYENACTAFIEKILTDHKGFLPSILPFVKKVVSYAVIYSLAQVLLKITAPGIPDIYQGCELWDLSYVDPDNRRPVDYKKRIALLDQIKAKEKEGSASLFSFLGEHHDEGAEKLFVTWKALNFRRHNEAIFREGSYDPLQASGNDPAVCAFVRTFLDQHVIIAVPLGVARKSEKGEKNEESIILPEHFPQQWTNHLTGKTHDAGDAGLLSLQELFADFPVAILRGS